MQLGTSAQAASSGLWFVFHKATYFCREALNSQLLNDASQRNTPSTLDIQGQMQQVPDHTSGKLELPLPLLFGALPQLLKNSDLDDVNMGYF